NWKLKIENFKEGSVLITLPDYDKNLILAARNLPEVDTIWARNLNVLDLLTFKYLIMPKESIKVIKETFLKSIK
ncbi:MAG: 50S ribosomal protein L4, partial [Candidatus Nealsonbacteria bacterium CG_4_9_14_3_um_filter_37_13]